MKGGFKSIFNNLLYFIKILLNLPYFQLVAEIMTLLLEIHSFEQIQYYLHCKKSEKCENFKIIPIVCDMSTNSHNEDKPLTDRTMTHCSDHLDLTEQS